MICGDSPGPALREPEMSPAMPRCSSRGYFDPFFRPLDFFTLGFSDLA